MPKKIQDEIEDKPLSNAEFLAAETPEEGVEQEEVEAPEDDTDLPDEQPVEEKPEVKTEEKPEVVENEASVYAKLRREARAREQAEAKAREAQEELKQYKSAPIQNEQPKQANQDIEPENKQSPEWLAWKIRDQDRQLSEIREFKESQAKSQQFNEVYQGAIQEFQTYEAEFAASVPDYNEASEALKIGLKEDIKAENPKLTPAQIEKEYVNRILGYAGAFVKMGRDPARSLYNMAKTDYGYEGKKPETPVLNGKKPNLELIESNKRKSMTPISGAGSGGSGELTLEDLDKMSNAQLMKLNPEVLKRLEGR